MELIELLSGGPFRAKKDKGPLNVRFEGARIMSEDASLHLVGGGGRA